MNDLTATELDIKQRTASFTGHRTYNGAENDELRMLIGDLYAHGVRRFLCGMAWGFDLAAGEIVAELKREFKDIQLVAVEPFDTFHTLFHNSARRLYDSVMAAADEHVVVSENNEGAYMARNRYLINNASIVIAWWNGHSRSGTAYTVRYARHMRIPVINIYPDPQLELEL